MPVDNFSKIQKVWLLLDTLLGLLEKRFDPRHFLTFQIKLPLDNERPLCMRRTAKALAVDSPRHWIVCHNMFKRAKDKLWSRSVFQKKLSLGHEHRQGRRGETNFHEM